MKNTCIIIDDEPNALSLLESYIIKTPALELKGKFFDALDALGFLKRQPVDLIFTDINMPVLSGLELAEVLPRQQKFIFTTAYAEHALSSFSYHVVDYLLKPITFSRFLQATAKIPALMGIPGKIEKAEPQSVDYFFAKSGGQVVKIIFEDIIYIKGEKEYVSLHFASERLLIYKRMKEMEQLLPVNFKRIHLSFIVNINHLQKIVNNHVVLMNEKIPISDSYREAFLSFLGGKMI